MEALQIDARRDHYHTLRLVIIVLAVLLVHLLVRTGDHHGRVVERLILRLDALRDVVLVLDCLRLDALFHQPLALDVSERMSGKYQRNLQQAGQMHADVTGICIMCMDDIRQSSDSADVFERLVRETVEMRP